MDLLDRIAAAGVIEYGDFELSHAGRSDTKVNMEKAWATPALLGDVAEEVALHIDERVTCLAAEGRGGLFAVHLSVITNLPLTYQMKDEFGLYVPTADDVVAVIDDVVTTGGTMRKISGPLEFDRKVRVLEGHAVISRGDADIGYPVHSLYTMEALLQRT